MSFTYGSRNYAQGPYGGDGDPYELAGIVAGNIEVYDPTGAFKALYQTGVGEFLGMEFSVDDSGSKDFTLFFANVADIEKKDIIRIKLFDTEEYFFTGVIRTIPIEGSTKLEFNYSGFGLNDYLLRVNTESQNYVGDTISDIVEDLVDNIITVKSPINKNSAKIDNITTVISDITFKYISASQALSQLRDIAQSDGNEYIVGVDNVGDFFFKQRSDETQATLVVGKKGRYGIEEYQPEDSIEERTKYYVLDKDGTFVTTVSSTLNNDIFEEKLTAPDIANSDISNWAQGILTTAEITTRQASINWEIWKNAPELIVADGYIRVISNILEPSASTLPGSSIYGSGTYGSGLYGGAQYEGKDLDDTLKIKGVNYIVNSDTANRTIQLGGSVIQLEKQLVEVSKNVEALRISLGR